MTFQVAGTLPSAVIFAKAAGALMALSWIFAYFSVY
jgi:hypothetical protein